MSPDEVVIRSVVRDERAGLARVTAYRPDTGETTFTVMLSVVDSPVLPTVAAAALNRKKSTMEVLGFTEQ